ATADAHGLPTITATPRFASARLYASLARWLFRRDEMIRLGWFMNRRRRVVPPPAANAPLLFVTSRPRHHYVVDPLAAATRAAGIATRALANPGPERELAERIDALTEAGTPAGFLSDYVTTDEAKRLVRANRRRFRQVWRRIASSPEFRRALCWEGVSLE